MRGAFATRNFRLYVAANAVNLLGRWAQRTALAWLVWELTASTTWLGLLALAELLPALVIGPFGGAAADRGDRLQLARRVQGLALLHALLLGLSTLAGCNSAPLLLGWALLQGVLMAFWQPLRLALVPSLVGADALPAAVAINSIVFNLARCVGPALAGLALVAAGAGWAFLFNAAASATFLAALGALRLAPQQRRPAAAAAGGGVDALCAGLRYALADATIRPLLLLLLLTALTLRPFAELLPGFAARLGGGAATLSLLASAFGAGAVVGGLWLMRQPPAALRRITPRAAPAYAALLALFAFAPTPAAAAALLAAAGAVGTLFGAGLQTLLQLRVDPALRGRVMALYGMTVAAGPALGALAIGAVADRTGLGPPALAGCALALCGWAWLRLSGTSERRRRRGERGARQAPVTARAGASRTETRPRRRR